MMLRKTILILMGLYVILGVSRNVYSQEATKQVVGSQSIGISVQELNQKLNSMRQELKVLMIQGSQLKNMSNEHKQAVELLGGLFKSEVDKDKKLNLMLDENEQSLRSLTKQLMSEIDKGKQLEEQLNAMMVESVPSKFKPSAVPGPAPAKSN